MYWLNNLSFKIKIRFPLALIATLMCCIVLMGVSLQKEVSNANNVILETHLPATEFLLEADRDLHQSLIALLKLDKN